MFDALAEDGIVHPALLNKPALRGDCINYYDAFCLLGASRMWTQVGPNPIPVSEIESYLRIIGVEETPTKLKYLRLVQLMDGVELAYHAEESKKRSKDSK